MYLKEVVINGFKSFADRTRIDLRPGITAIVGPNGCGKSNIVDAIRWVLGEQSAKALRGGNMQDVIFSGTDKRKPLPLCEVELVFTDCEAQLGTAFNEVSIARRVSRDGGSDYFLNGKPCRLKDVQRLFMDTGIGRESYSFMMQGQIDRILSANPAERRILFEEAAGITRYKSQRKEALGKLALVDQNLARITDVIEEVSRQIGTLKRQASKALRYKRLKHRLTHLDLAWQTCQYTRRRDTIIEFEAKAATFRETVAALQEALRDREAVLVEAKAERAALFDKLQENQQLAFNLRSEKENAENQAKFVDTRVQDVRERTTQVSQEIDALDARIAELEARLAGESQTKAAHAGEVETSDEAHRVRLRELDEATATVSSTESSLRQQRQDLLMAEGEITRHRSSVTNIEVDLKSYQSRHGDLVNALHQLREQRIGIENRLAETETATENRRAEVAAARSEVEASAEESKRLAAEFRQAQQQIQEVDRQVARMSAQLTMLEQLHAKFEG
ncbi:MAG: AAA family ATPase, partial [Puniceicoccales bacterium]|nr:AAA family ATPase [Puniceicoccales bacterium]